MIIHVSPTGTDNENCGEIIYPCMTMDKALELSSNKPSTKMEIVLSSSKNQQLIYPVNKMGYIFNKALVFRKDSNENEFNPIIQNNYTRAEYLLIFENNGTLEIDGIDWKNVLLARFLNMKNIYVKMNNSNIASSFGHLSFMSFPYNLFKISMWFHNCKFDSWPNYILKITTNLSNINSSVFQFIKCKFILKTRTASTFDSDSKE